MKQRIKLIVIISVEFIAIALILVMIFLAGKKSYTVTFDPNGGILISGDLEQRVTQGHNATPPQVAKDGCYFLRWSGSYNTITHDVTLYAIWEYETSDGIKYSTGSGQNYCEISGSFGTLTGEIYIGAYYNDKKLLGIKEGAFRDQTRITGIHLLDGIIVIENEVFKNCTSMTTIEIPSTTVLLGDEAFYGCESLEEIVLPEGLEYIGNGAFAGCKSLKEITIPKTVKYIGEGSFEGCDALESVTIEDGAEEIGASAFAGCAALTEVKLPGSITLVGAGAFDTEGIKILIPKDEDGNIIGEYADGWCSEDAVLEEYTYTPEAVDDEADSESTEEEE